MLNLNGGVKVASGRFIALAVCVFLWPLLYNYRFLVSGEDFTLLIGNDFGSLYYVYKCYLLEHLVEGVLPLWSPGEAAGYPFYSNPFTQTFYPLNLLLIPYYKIAGGYTGYDHQIFTVFGASLFSLGLFLWLTNHFRKLGLIVYACLAISISFKINEMFRFPNAMHSAAWMPWILYGVSLAAKREYAWRSFGVILVACLMLLTSGYLYYAYYCLFLVPIYLVFFILPGRRERHHAYGRFDVPVSWFFVRVSAPSTLALGICSPYLYKVYKLLEQTADRGGGDYGYATAHGFSVLDTLGSWVYPPAASMEGWYYFGMANVLVVLLGLALVAGMKEYRIKANVIFYLFSFGWIMFVSSITWGAESFVFGILWDILPGFSHLRVWGRLNVVLLPVLAFILAFSLRLVLSFLTDLKSGEADAASVFRVWALFSSAVGLILLIQFWLYTVGVKSNYWIKYNTFHHGTEFAFILSTLAAWMVISILIGGCYKGWGLRGWHLMVVLMLLVVVDVRPVGSRQWTEGMPIHSNAHKPCGFMQKERAFRAKRINKKYTLFMPPLHNVGVVQNWYYDRYVSLYKTINPTLKPDRSGLKESKAFDWLTGVSSGHRLFLSKSVSHDSVESFLADVWDVYRHVGLRLELVEFTGDRLEIKVFIKSDLYLTYVDNWDSDWRAAVDGVETDMDLLLGTFKSVSVKAGVHTVVFDYCPFFSCNLLPKAVSQ